MASSQDVDLRPLLRQVEKHSETLGTHGAAIRELQDIVNAQRSAIDDLLKIVLATLERGGESNAEGQGLGSVGAAADGATADGATV